MWAMIGMCGTAVLTVLVGSHRSLTLEKEKHSSNRSPEADVQLLLDQEMSGMDMRLVWLVPVVLSATLLLFFYLFHFLSLVLLLYMCCASMIAMAFTLRPLMGDFSKRICSCMDHSSLAIPWMGQVSFTNLPLSVLCTAIVVVWIYTGHWLLNNVMGVSLCVFALALLQTKNLKIAVCLLCGLFVYDVFWVFYSASVFDKNVMVEVATQEASNPMHASGLSHVLPSFLPAPSRTLPLPVKLMFPSWAVAEDGSVVHYFHFLGLGDIVLPGLVVALCRRFDHFYAVSRGWGYHAVGIAGYTVGLVCTMIASQLTHLAQPALLYLVPCVLVPVVAVAVCRGDLSRLWQPPELQSADDAAPLLRYVPGEGERERECTSIG